MKYNTLTDAKKLWITTHVDDYPSISALYRGFCRIFPEKIGYATIYFCATYNRHPKHKLSEEEKKWIKAHYKNYKNREELLKALNEKFNRDIYKQAFQYHLNDLNIDYRQVYHDECIQWLKDNCKHYHRDQFDLFLNDFNNKFEFNLTKPAFLNLCKQYNIQYNKSYNRLPLGSLRYKNGYLYIKVKEEDPNLIGRRSDDQQSYTKPWWVKANEYIYSIYVRPLKEDETLFHLDGNPNNLNPENLYPVTINQMRSFSRSDLKSDDPEINKIGLLNTQLQYALREAKGTQ